MCGAASTKVNTILWATQLLWSTPFSDYDYFCLFDTNQHDYIYNGKSITVQDNVGKLEQVNT